MHLKLPPLHVIPTAVGIFRSMWKNPHLTPKFKNDYDPTIGYLTHVLQCIFIHNYFVTKWVF